MAVLVIIFILLPFGAVSPVSAENQNERGSASVATWSRTYGSGSADSVQQTSDGGFVVAGHSFGGWVFKTNDAGETEWSKYYTPAGYANAWASSVTETRDKGYIVGGFALSVRAVTGYDAWLLRLDHKGNVQWSKTYGGHGDDTFSSVQQTSDGGYVAAGTTGSFGPGVQYSGITAWVFRLDARGNVIWEKDFGADEADSVEQTSDGGFIVAGTAAVGNQPNADAWVFKLDSEGSMVWQKGFEVTIDTRGYSIQQTHDGGFILAGHSALGALFLRLDPTGNPLWQRSYSGGESTQPFSIRETSDNGFIVAGRSSGPFLLRLSAWGNIVWQKVYGLPNDFFYQAQETRGGGLIVAGWLFETGSAWVLKLNGAGTIGSCPLGVPSNGTIIDTAAIVTNTKVAGLSTDATVTQTSVIVATAHPSVQTQCVSALDMKNGKSSHHHHESHHHRKPSPARNLVMET